jgi:excisionase family DNA binding protein
VLPVLLEDLKEVEQGHSVAVLSTERILTTQQAANLLRVSRPHRVKLLDPNVIPSQPTGAHRRVRVADLLVYKKQREEEQDRFLHELTQEAQEIGLDY